MGRNQYRTEFHIHTHYSHDSYLGKRAVRLMCKLKHINCIAITDHNCLDGAIEFQSYLKHYSIEVIPGEEIFTKEGEIIGLYLKEEIQPGLSAEETVRLILLQGGLVYIPHPYDEKRNKTVISRTALDNIRDSIACMEVHNGRNIEKEYDSKQARIASELAVPRIIGCDAHCFFEIGRNYCLTSQPFSKESFASVLQGAEFCESRCIRASHLVTVFVRGLKKIRNGEFNEICRIINSRIRSRIKKACKTGRK